MLGKHSNGRTKSQGSFRKQGSQGVITNRPGVKPHYKNCDTVENDL